MTLGESDPVQNKFSINIRCHFFRKSSGDGSSIEFRSLTAYTDRMNSALVGASMVAPKFRKSGSKAEILNKKQRIIKDC